MFGLFWASLIELQATPVDVKLETPQGPVTLIDPSVISDFGSPQLSVTVSNDLNASWVDFTAAFEGAAACSPPRGSVPVSFTASLGPIWANEKNHRVSQISLAKDLRDCSFLIGSAKIIYAGNLAKERLDQASRRRDEESRPLTEALTATTKAHLNHLEYLRTLPVISSGEKQAFIAHDKKCLDELRAAAPLEGVQGRKRLAGIIAVCGVFIESGSHAASYSLDGEYGFVSISDSEIKGWVPRTWIWVPVPK